MFRYSLRDVFCLQTLAPISASAVFAAELFSGAVLDYLDPFERIVSATGWPLYTMHTLFPIILSTSNSIIYGGMVALGMLSLFLLSNRWATLVAFSLPFGILFLLCLRFWISAVPANVENALIIAKWFFIPTLVAPCLLYLGWRFKSRMPIDELSADAAFFQRPPWQGYFLAGTCVIYLLASAYGWYGMVSSRTEMSQMWHQLEQSEQLR